MSITYRDTTGYIMPYSKTFDLNGIFYECEAIRLAKHGINIDSWSWLKCVDFYLRNVSIGLEESIKGGKLSGLHFTMGLHDFPDPIITDSDDLRTLFVTINNLANGSRKIPDEDFSQIITHFDEVMWPIKTIMNDVVSIITDELYSHMNDGLTRIYVKASAISKNPNGDLISTPLAIKYSKMDNTDNKLVIVSRVYSDRGIVRGKPMMKIK